MVITTIKSRIKLGQVRVEIGLKINSVNNYSQLYPTNYSIKSLFSKTFFHLSSLSTVK